MGLIRSIRLNRYVRLRLRVALRDSEYSGLLARAPFFRAFPLLGLLLREHARALPQARSRGKHARVVLGDEVRFRLLDSAESKENVLTERSKSCGEA